MNETLVSLSLWISLAVISSQSREWHGPSVISSKDKKIKERLAESRQSPRDLFTFNVCYTNQRCIYVIPFQRISSSHCLHRYSVNILFLGFLHMVLAQALHSLRKLASSSILHECNMSSCSEIGDPDIFQLFCMLIHTYAFIHTYVSLHLEKPDFAQ